MKTLIKIIIVSILLTACKKEKPTTSNSSPVPPEPDSPYTISTATVFSGEFLTTVRTATNGTTVIMGSGVDVNILFYQPPCSTCSPIQPVNVNYVELNNNSMSILVEGNYIGQSNDGLTTERWQVKGKNTIPSFIYTDTMSAPDSDRNISLPDFVGKSAGFTFTLNNVLNTDTSSQIFFYDLNNSVAKVTKPISEGNNSIMITPTDLSSFSTGNSNFVVTLNHSKLLNFYGKDFKFSKQRTYSKIIQIQP